MLTATENNFTVQFSSDSRNWIKITWKKGVNKVVHEVSMCNAGSVWLVCFSPSVADILSAGCCSTGSPTFITKGGCKGTLYLGCLVLHTTSIRTIIRNKTPEHLHFGELSDTVDVLEFKKKNLNIYFGFVITEIIDLCCVFDCFIELRFCLKARFAMWCPMWAINIAKRVKLHILPPAPLFLYKGTINKSLLETNQVCVAMAGDWSVAMAGRKTVKDSVRVRSSLAWAKDWFTFNE